jgi:hypothetical protein
MPKTMPGTPGQQNRYRMLMDQIFFDRYRQGLTEIDFKREDIEGAAQALGMKLPKNLGDVIYSFRFRTAFSDRMLATQPVGTAWRIELAGTGLYKFVLGKESTIRPAVGLPIIGVPDATPAIISAYALDDEQALLAIVRYNRLIDVFLSLTTYSLQNHLRTTVKGVGQIEIDELYVGVDSLGHRYVIPVQAKGGRDRISVVQTIQDTRACAEKFSSTVCRPVSVQFLADKTIAMFELTAEAGDLSVVAERHYRLVKEDDKAEKN